MQNSASIAAIGSGGREGVRTVDMEILVIGGDIGRLSADLSRLYVASELW